MSPVKYQEAGVMKRPLLSVFVLGLGMWASATVSEPQAPAANGLTATEVIAKCAEAMGGKAKIDGLKTLRVGAVYPDHGDKTFITEIKRPNMSYEAASYLVFDGKQACLLKGLDTKSGPQLVDEEDLVDFDVIVGSIFPSFFDFPSDYIGAEKVDGRPTHKIRPKLPHGAEMIYYIDAATWLPYKFITHMTIRGLAFDAERRLSDYRDVDGILYPHGFTYLSRDGKSVLQGRLTSVEINPVLDDAHFMIPKDIK
jgi:zinc protease